MLYKKGSYAIKINGTGEYGIKPSLWIYNSNTNTYVKVATFQNIDLWHEQTFLRQLWPGGEVE